MNELESGRLTGFLKSDATWPLIVYTRYFKHLDEVNQLIIFVINNLLQQWKWYESRCIAQTVINYYSVKVMDID